MTQRIRFGTAVFCFLVLLYGGCENTASPNGGPKGLGDLNQKITVTYYNNTSKDDDTVFLTYDWLKNTATTAPITNPSKPEFTFEGWYADKGKQTPFDFTQTLQADTKIYAGYTNVIELTLSSADYLYTLSEVYGRILKGAKNIGNSIYYDYTRKFQNEHGDSFGFSHAYHFGNGGSAYYSWGFSYKRAMLDTPITVIVDEGESKTFERNVSFGWAYYDYVDDPSQEDEGGQPGYVHKRDGYFWMDYHKSRYYPNPMFYRFPEIEFGSDINFSIKAYGADKIVIADSLSRIVRGGVYYAVD
ncbi:MAG: InlB B-repeat-containing protein [Treponema sp.]|jgi:uncharacterized repeat protein (TIGR02543 family)|nr:InlB B-repeat-containing protein [Treponema sp.]